MLYTIKKALDCYEDKKIWNKLIKRAMKCDNSWEKSADLYKELYENL